jgi:hypothetical protein
MVRLDSRGISNRLASLGVLLVVVVALFGAFIVGRQRADRLRTVYKETSERSQLAAAMEANLLAATAAERSAVMAETDEASKESAEASRRASGAVEADRSALAELIETAGKPQQIEQLSAFNECWARYQEIDRQILDLAVKNSNLKALRLCFTAAAAALDRMQSALNGVVDGSDSIASTRAAYRAMTAARRVHALEVRHIPEPRDDEMDRIEADMKSLDGQVAEALGALSAGDDATRASVDAARGAYAEFQKVHAEILVLSRRNSNVRSLALSLGQKRNVSAECQDRLSALRESLKADLINATR